MDRREFGKISGAAAAAMALPVGRSRASDDFIETDLLIVGSGFAGLWAALAAYESGIKNIAIVDKASIGRSSMSSMCAGATIYRFPGDDPQEWLRDVAEANNYLSRQDLISRILDTSYDRYRKLESWGVKYHRAPTGQKRMPSRGFKHLRMCVLPAWKEKQGGSAVAAALYEQIEGRKPLIFSKTMITELLLCDGRVAGAVGVNRLDGTTVAFRARSVILAAADCSFRGNYACVDQVTGDGFRLAYQAGTRLTNMEFLCSNTASPHYGFEGTGVAARYGAKYLNKNRHPFMKDYHPHGDKAEVAYITRAMAEEVEKGNGPPMFFDLSALPFGLTGEWALSKVGGWVKLNLERLKERGLDIFSRPQEWVAAIQTLRGGVRTDSDFMSDIPGLFAAGMTQSIDPGLFNGWSTMRAMGSGELTGRSAAQFIKGSADVKPDPREASAAVRRAKAALGKELGVSPEKVLSEIQETMAPYPVCIRRSEKSLSKALRIIERIRDNDLPGLAAEDPHELGKAHEAVNMTLAAELYLRAALTRKESRSDHFRVEFPKLDNRNWLKWINLRKDKDGSPLMEFEDVPVSRYPVKPG